MKDTRHLYFCSLIFLKMKMIMLTLLNDNKFNKTSDNFSIINKMLAFIDTTLL